jgi:hypothetical protein
MPTEKSKQTVPSGADNETGRNPSGFDLGTLNVAQKELHEEITALWNDVCKSHASLGHKLLEMHATFKRNGTVKAGGPGSRWTKYLAEVGIPKSTAKDHMGLATKRRDAGIPAAAEEHLASVGVPLDKPKVVDALLTPELRQEVGAIESAEDAEALKPRIMEIARTPQPKTKDDKLSADADSTIDKAKSVTAAVHYLDRFAGQELRKKFAEYIHEVKSALADKLTPAYFSKYRENLKRAEAYLAEAEPDEPGVEQYDEDIEQINSVLDAVPEVS